MRMIYLIKDSQKIDIFCKLTIETRKTDFTFYFFIIVIYA